MDKHMVPWIADKELMRAMQPRFAVDSYQQLAVSGGQCYDLGNGSWMADLNALPALSSDLHSLIQEQLSFSFSVAHFLTPAFTSTRVIYIPRGYAEMMPLAIHWNEKEAHAHASNLLSSELLILIVEDDAHITCIEQCKPEGFQARALMALIGDRAQITFMSDYQYGEEAYGSEHERWQLGTDTQLNRITSVTGGRQSWHFQNYILGRRASLEQTALTALRANEQSALITKQQHVGEASKSSVLVKAALSDESNSFYRGTIAISEQAKLSEAHQQQRALMLSSKARACAIPSLEVATHDVQCSHGSAAGRFNSEEMGYLRARGLERASAEKLLIRGFFNDPALEKYSEHVAYLQERLICRSI